MEGAQQTDSRGRKIYLAALLHPRVFLFGLSILGLGFLLQIISEAGLRLRDAIEERASRVSSSKGQSRLKDRWCCDPTISSSSCLNRLLFACINAKPVPLPLRAQGREAISWGTYTASIDYFEADFATASLSRFITSSPHALANGRSEVLMVRSPTFCTNSMTMGDDAEAVVLDFVQPLAAGRQLVGLCWKARRDEAGR